MRRSYLLIGFFLLINYCANTSALFFPHSLYPTLGSFIVDSSDDNPASLIPKTHIGFSMTHINNDHVRKVTVPANGNFLYTRYEMEPDKYAASRQRNKFFPFNLNFGGKAQEWLWEFDFQLIGANVFKFDEDYYFTNPVTNTMDSVGVSVRNDLSLFRFRGKIGIHVSDKTTVAIAPLLYYGSYVLTTEKVFQYNGIDPQFESYAINMDCEYSGVAPGLQIGVIHREQNYLFKLALDYNSFLKFKGDTTFDAVKTTDSFMLRLPIKLAVGFEIPIDGYNVLQLTEDFEYWNGRLYDEFPSEVDLKPIRLNYRSITGIGWLMTFTDNLFGALGYQFYMLPSDSRQWQYLEMDSQYHQVSGRLSYALDPVYLHLSAGYFIREGEDSPPSAFSASFGINYLY